MPAFASALAECVIEKEGRVTIQLSHQDPCLILSTETTSNSLEVFVYLLSFFILIGLSLLIPWLITAWNLQNALEQRVLRLFPLHYIKLDHIVIMLVGYWQVLNHSLLDPTLLLNKVFTDI